MLAFCPGEKMHRTREKSNFNGQFHVLGRAMDTMMRNRRERASERLGSANEIKAPSEGDFRQKNGIYAARPQYILECDFSPLAVNDGRKWKKGERREKGMKE